MADYEISNVPRRVVYAPSGVGPYAFTFEILAASDIAVYRGSTLLTLTTNYTVTINANGTGSVTLVTTAGTSNITIVGAKNIQRTTDFTTGGDFFANTLNDELDAQTIFIQQVAETAERGLKAPVIDPTDINMTLPSRTARASKYLAFDASGNPVAGENAVEITTVAGVADDIAALGPISDDISAVAGVAGDISSVANIANDIAAVADVAADIEVVSQNIEEILLVTGNADDAAQSASEAAASASAASTSASSALSAKNSAESARDATLAAYDSFDDRYLGSKTSNPTLDNDGNALVAGALYFNSVDGVMKVYTGSVWTAAYVSGDGVLLIANNLSDLNNASSARTNLGLGTAATQNSTAFMQGSNNLSEVTNTTTARSNLGLVIGTNVQAYDAQLADVAGLTPTDNAVIIGNGTNFVVESGATLKTSLGLTIGTDVQAYDANTVKTNVAQTFTALQTFAGSSSVADLKTSNILETATISATAATGTINFDLTTQSVLHYTTNASGNFTINFRGSSGTSLNTVMSTGESISATFICPNGTTAYYNSAVQVDGSSVTPKWQGGTAPTSGNASSHDVYTYVIIKTGSATFTVLASQTKFA
jgi:hypothetical protein